MKKTPAIAFRPVVLGAALALACLGNAALGQLPVTSYSYTVSPSSSYPDTAPPTKLTNGTTLVNVWPNTADSAALVGWNSINPGIQFNFTGGQSVSEVTVWAANSKGSAGVALPQTITITSGSYSRTLTVTPPAGSGTTVPLTITGISAAGDSFTITAARADAWTMFSEVQFFGTGAKAANTNALNLASSWTGGRAPVSTDVALFNSTFTATTPLDTGAAVDWAGIEVTGGSGTLTIDPTTSANRLGIGTSGIDLSAATRNVRLTDLRLTGSTAQTWSIASGRSLTVGADSLAQDAGANPTLSGAGTLVKEGSSTSLTLGSLTSFTGTLDVQAGSVTTSAANQLTGNYAVSLAAGATLQLGGNDTLPTSMNSGTGTIEILQSNALTITNTAARTVDRVFSGTGSLAKTGTGMLTLSGNSSFSGGLVIEGGAGNASTVVAGSDTAFGTGTVTVRGGSANTGSTLDVNGATLANNIVIANGNSGVDGLGALQNKNTTNTAVLNGSVQLGGENYVGGDGGIIFNGVVSGGLNNVYSLFKQGTGTWRFNNTANTFDGFYYQIGGVTEVTKLANAGEASSLGQVTSGQNLFVFGFNGDGGGTLRYIGNAASTSDRVFSLRGSTAAADNTIEAAGTSAGATLTLTGGLSAGRAGNYTARLAGDNAGENVYSGVIANGSGTVALEKTGGTTWVLTGSNTYSGGTTISGGVLAVGTIADSGASALGNSGTLSLAGATLRYTGASSNATARVVDLATAGTNTIDVSDASGQLALNGKVWNTATNHPNVVLNKTGAGLLSIGGAGANQGLSLAAREGVTLLNATTNAVYEVRALDTGATIRLGNNFQIFGGDAISTTGNIRMTGGTLDLNGFNETVNRLSGAELTNAGTGIITSATAATFTVGNNFAGRASQFAGSLQGALNLAIKGTNKVTLTGENTYTGTTTVGSGTLQIGDGGTSGTLGAGAVTLSNAATLVLSRSDNTSVANTISGAGALTKSGFGTLTLTGTNTYSGATTVAAGQLTVNGAADNTTITVENAATLGGSGSVGGIVLNLGSKVSPGNSIGSLAATNAVLGGGASFELEVFDWLGSEGAGWDLLAVNGDLTLNNTTNSPFSINLVSLQNTNTPGLSTNWNAANSFTNRFISYTGSLLGTAFTPDLFTVNTSGFQNVFNGTFSVTSVNQGLALLYTPNAAPIPEPGTWAAAALLVGGAAYMRWRRRGKGP